jgi:hypothetical protein
MHIIYRHCSNGKQNVNFQHSGIKQAIEPVKLSSDSLTLSGSTLD